MLAKFAKPFFRKKYFQKFAERIYFEKTELSYEAYDLQVFLADLYISRSFFIFHFGPVFSLVLREISRVVGEEENKA